MAYTKNTWRTGDIVSSQKLNHMEDGIAGANVFVRIKAVITDNGIVAEKNKAEIDAILAAGNIPVITVGDEEEVTAVSYYAGKFEAGGETATVFANVSITETNTVAIDLYEVDANGRVLSLGGAS